GRRQGSWARRAIIGVLAIYALLLQGFLGASVHLPGVLDTAGGANCTIDGAGPGTPGKESAPHHGLCCILACAAAACAYVWAASGAVAFPERTAAKIDFRPAEGLAAREPLKYYFAARGPPLAL
ncbi:MAG TPA: hypothetical protein VFF88_05115, partial [Methylocella sp.]|nr:hypothetical protein [Methylocella sp.]